MYLIYEEQIKQLLVLLIILDIGKDINGYCPLFQ